jgi:alkylhydroperoxidase family enzyme
MNQSRNIHTGPIDFDVAAREIEVLGECQRIEPLAFEDMSDEARQLLRDVGRSFGSQVHDAREADYVAEPHRIKGAELPGRFHIPANVAAMMRHPRLFQRQFELAKEIVGHGAISARERELIVLRVHWLSRAPFPWAEHVEIAKLSGVRVEEIERVTLGSSADGWNEHDRALLRATEELICDQRISDETWDDLAIIWNPKQLIEFPVVVGNAFTMALQQNSLKMTLPEHNQGLRQR